MIHLNPESYNMAFAFFFFGVSPILSGDRLSALDEAKVTGNI